MRWRSQKLRNAKTRCYKCPKKSWLPLDKGSGNPPTSKTNNLQTPEEKPGHTPFAHQQGEWGAQTSTFTRVERGTLYPIGATEAWVEILGLQLHWAETTWEPRLPPSQGRNRCILPDPLGWCNKRHWGECLLSADKAAPPPCCQWVTRKAPRHDHPAQPGQYQWVLEGSQTSYLALTRRPPRSPLGDNCSRVGNQDFYPNVAVPFSFQRAVRRIQLKTESLNKTFQNLQR